MEIALKNIWKPAQPTELELMSAQDFDYFISFKKNPGIQTGTFATVSKLVKITKARHGIMKSAAILLMFIEKF